jgi:hypothetical protein
MRAYDVVSELGSQYANMGCAENNDTNTGSRGTQEVFVSPVNLSDGGEECHHYGLRRRKQAEGMQSASEAFPVRREVVGMKC